jgi:hypothetical protein
MMERLLNPLALNDTEDSHTASASSMRRIASSYGRSSVICKFLGHQRITVRVSLDPVAMEA